MNAEILIAKIPPLQAPSETVVRLLNLLNRPDADFDEVIATVCHDPVLSAKLVGICNSPIYGLAEPVASVEQGVLYLGYEEIHRLTMAIGFGSQINAPLRGYDMGAGELWMHSVVTARLMPKVLELAKKLTLDSSVAYTAGLLHDIGKLVIGQALDDEQRRAIHARVEKGGESLLQAERTVIGCDHAEAGGYLLRQWRLPEIIVGAVEHHHHPTGQPTLAAMVHVADAIAHQSGASPGWTSMAVTFDGSAAETLGLTPGGLETLTLDAFDAQCDLAAQDFSSGSRPPGSGRSELKTRAANGAFQENIA